MELRTEEHVYLIYLPLPNTFYQPISHPTSYTNTKVLQNSMSFEDKHNIF